MRRLMTEWNDATERRGLDLQGIANDLVRRSREFERK